MRQELNHLGQIVPYEGTVQLLSNPEAVLNELLTQNGFNVELIEKDGSVFIFKYENANLNISKNISIFYGNIRNESRNDYEKKIQLNGKDPRNKSAGVDENFILGVYCYNENDPLKELIVAGWPIDESINFPSNPSLRGINVNLFQVAKNVGFVKNEFRNSQVFIFRPEFIHYYIANSLQLHYETQSGNQRMESTATNEENKNVIYYGAPGTGKSHRVEQTIQNLDKDFYERVTFHPEFDNASFIGGYKPTPIEEGDKKGDVTYTFIPQAFAKIYARAWKDTEGKDYYLVIEEINRGNCAEIFGEIFQLLDRNSTYDVSPSEEFRKYLVKELGSEDHDGIKRGLKLPPNLHIWATMNTSDQSLFPMDSAFKRRWQWEYCPICYTDITEDDTVNESFNYEIDIQDGKKYRWIDFIKKININHIKSEPTLGADKCIGNYFIKPDEGNTINLKPFINKVIFYLWNDVFKDEQNSVFEENTSYEDFFPINSAGKQKIKELFSRIGLEPIPNSNHSPQNPDNIEQTENQPEE